MILKGHRQFLEFSIIGSCILENKYDDVKFLSAKNFRVWGEYDLPFLWECLPGSLFIVSARAKKKGRDMHNEIAELTNFAVYSHLQPIALSLMEDEFRTSFIKVLNGLLLRNDNATHKSAITEILYEFVDESKDTFELIGAGIGYLKKFDHVGITEAMDLFDTRMKEKIKDIKKITNGIHRVS